MSALFIWNNSQAMNDSSSLHMGRPRNIFSIDEQRPLDALAETILIPDPKTAKKLILEHSDVMSPLSIAALIKLGDSVKVILPGTSLRRKEHVEILLVGSAAAAIVFGGVLPCFFQSLFNIPIRETIIPFVGCSLPLSAFMYYTTKYYFPQFFFNDKSKIEKIQVLLREELQKKILQFNQRH